MLQVFCFKKMILIQTSLKPFDRTLHLYVAFIMDKRVFLLKDLSSHPYYLKFRLSLQV